MDAPFGKICGDECYGIHYFKELESTNDMAQKPKYKHKDIIVSDAQTKGRGQGGNTWTSEPGKNLMFSMIIEPNGLQAAKQFLLSEIISLSITDTLASYKIKASIKWPNDIYIKDKKVAGILIENEVQAGKITRSIIGVGLNVNQTEFDNELAHATSMSIMADREFNRSKVLTRLCNYFSLRSEQLYDGDTKWIEDDYFSRLYLANTPHTFKLPDGTRFRGTIRSVSESGELNIETHNGSIRTFLFKEVAF